MRALRSGWPGPPWPGCTTAPSGSPSSWPKSRAGSRHGAQYSMKKIANHKRVLVTGGAGFLGSHVCDRLVADGCDVLCADDFFSRTKDNLADLIGNPRFVLLPHDVTFPPSGDVDEIDNVRCPAYHTP